MVVSGADPDLEGVMPRGPFRAGRLWRRRPALRVRGVWSACEELQRRGPSGGAQGASGGMLQRGHHATLSYFHARPPVREATVILRPRVRPFRVFAAVVYGSLALSSSAALTAARLGHLPGCALTLFSALPLHRGTCGFATVAR